MGFNCCMDTYSGVAEFGVLCSKDLLVFPCVMLSDVVFWLQIYCDKNVVSAIKIGT